MKKKKSILWERTNQKPIGKWAMLGDEVVLLRSTYVSDELWGLIRDCCGGKELLYFGNKIKQEE